MVFTCLSHDIIAHETTHAILDGISPRFLDPSNVDVLAFHEAFADIVALFQHFTYPEILRRQIARARGDLTTETLLGQLAVQFGKATGARCALRDAIGEFDEVTGRWRRRTPDPDAFATTEEPHDRGALLVAAVFDAFLAIYDHRTRDLLRIATGGSGILPQGDLHPDLVARLAEEAAKTSRHILAMCIRAIDYCPPVDVSFGDFLRALITADCDMVPEDDRNYRVAVIEAFRRYGIYPRDVRTLSVESLRWQPPEKEDVKPFLFLLNRVLDDKTWSQKMRRRTQSRWEHDHYREQKLRGSPWQELLSGSRADMQNGFPVRIRLSRNDLWARTRWLAARFHEEIKEKSYLLHQTGALKGRPGLMGLNFSDGHDDDAKFSVETVRPVRRVNPDGRERDDLLIQLTQRRPAFYDEARQRKETQRYRTHGFQSIAPPLDECDFKFRGGATFIVDLENFNVRYVIAKNILSEARLTREREFRARMAGTTLAELYFGGDVDGQKLARLHGGEF
jgi:hypothetical protein